MAVEYTKGRYFQDAAETARRAVDLTPDDPNAYYLAIKSHQDAGRYPEALEIAARAVSRFPESARAHFEYGFHLQKVGRVEEALRELERSMALDASYEEPPFFYGDLLQQHGRYGEAVVFLRRAIANRTDYVPARVALSKALMGLKKWEEAILELNEALRFDPRHPQRRRQARHDRTAGKGFVAETAAGKPGRARGSPRAKLPGALRLRVIRGFNIGGHVNRAERPVNPKESRCQ